MFKYIIIILLGVGLFSKTKQEESDKDDDYINLDPDVKPNEYYSKESNASDWLNSFLSEALLNSTKSKEVNLNPTKAVENQNCFTENNNPGVCVLYYLCDPDFGSIIEDGSTIIDLRNEGACPHYLEVCCMPERIIPDKKINETTNKFNEKPNQPDVLDDLGKSSNAGDPETCGWDNPALHIFQSKSKNTSDKLIYANYGEFPWMIALLRKVDGAMVWSREDYMGGGSLIHPGVVLTAAHTVKEIAVKDLKCRAGEWDTQTIYELFSHQERDVNKIVIHPNYSRPSLLNDMALVFLKSPFDLAHSPNIGIACIGTTLPAHGTVCYGMGWGKQFQEKNKYAVILKKVRLPLVGADECTPLLRKSRLGQFFELHESLTCAGGEEGLDTCRGDGGSSLVCPIQTLGENTRFALFGIVAYGLGCGKKNLPSVYVNVPHLKQWLDTTVAAEGYTNTTYNY